MTNLKVRAKSSPDINRLKSELISSAYKRAKRAINAGFFIEAIAIEESLICDRLEAILSRVSKTEVNISTIGKLIVALKPYGVLSEDLAAELQTWQKYRSQTIHQIVKVTNSESSDWRSRLRFARSTSVEGLQLFQKLKNLDTQVTRKLKQSK